MTTSKTWDDNGGRPINPNIEAAAAMTEPRYDLSSPELAFARVEFTTFERFGKTGYEAIAPVHVVKEWQWPGDRAKDQTPLWRTVRISEWKMPMRGWFKCDAVIDPEAPNSGWPCDPDRSLLLTAGEVRQELVDAGLIAPWYLFPQPDRPCLMLDGKAWIEHYGSVVSPVPNDGLPADYLDFWLEGSNDA